MQISRRGALLGASAVAAVAGVPVGVQVESQQLATIQALVADLRQVGGNTPMCVFVAFQETADRLEALPGIVPVPNEKWHAFKCRLNKTRKAGRIGPYLPAGRA